MKTVIILFGPTCVGKTSASVSIAKFLDTEIISADSMQIYRHMNIGTAKPNLKEMDGVVHHMIDIIEPIEMYSTGRYVETVAPIIESIHKREKIPIITGGTGLYMEALTRGLFKTTDADWSLRNKLLDLESENSGYLYRSLLEIDPVSAKKIMAQDIRRIIRAIEVYLYSGRGISDLQEIETKPLPYNFIKIGLMRGRAELYLRIDKRVDNMISDGLIDEVKELLKLNPSHTPMQAIGYKEIASYLLGHNTLEEAVIAIKQASRRYAKRQLSWFRRDGEIKWVEISGINDPSVIFDRVLEIVNESSLL
jgi:tRNA dimethylallyltransferase